MEQGPSSEALSYHLVKSILTVHRTQKFITVYWHVTLCSWAEYHLYSGRTSCCISNVGDLRQKVTREM
jgi:hypothetical protein